ncbi:unnamed protein product [Caenorhabditis angaria]|uniref:Tyrosine-protein kinase n=1 Tax=Caenorhabditis angaria TaxID=860376 RepID=A0A9P1ITR4_9PELO|nr:unnamed protein product [Caenorhabditis angaria]
MNKRKSLQDNVKDEAEQTNNQERYQLVSRENQSDRDDLELSGVAPNEDNAVEDEMIIEGKEEVVKKEEKKVEPKKEEKKLIEKKKDEPKKEEQKEVPTKREKEKGSKEKIKPESDSVYIKNTLIHYPWYHGLIQGSQVNDMLKWDGSFIVRRSGNGDENDVLCLSVRNNKQIHHYAFKNEGGNWTCPKLPDIDKNIKFPHIHLLLNYWSNKISGAIPIPRDKFVLFHDDVKMSKKLGYGEFGEVWEGKLNINGCTKKCAVKTIKGQVKKEQIKAFFHESKVMALFDNECIVKFYGQCTLFSPLMAVMELANGGTVRSHLRCNKNVSVDTMIKFVNDIAKGMEHLTSKSVIHRDLAARNCLIGDNLIVKISDFGLSVIGESIRVRTLKQAPMRWLSTETLTTGVFNEKTDVWSFACLEIKTVEKPHKFDSSQKSPPKEILAIMESCTTRQPQERPKFRNLVADLAKIIADRKKAKLTSRRRSSIKNRSLKVLKKVPRGIISQTRKRCNIDPPEKQGTSSGSANTASKSKESAEKIVPEIHTPNTPTTPTTARSPKHLETPRRQKC